MFHMEQFALRSLISTVKTWFHMKHLASLTRLC
jgi:hypothetical protein